eukprot:gb/GEZJ01006542.1/.p1 GENE.gb/GEZJ01006542.1/~~gb/GEZJ01006542.1/.p1  ORF type:complete len:112 (-),score=7.65 gb/GEZJ01006542.1/:145-480(-)
MEWYAGKVWAMVPVGDGGVLEICNLLAIDFLDGGQQLKSSRVHARRPRRICEGAGKVFELQSVPFSTIYSSRRIPSGSKSADRPAFVKVHQTLVFFSRRLLCLRRLQNLGR